MSAKNTTPRYWTEKEIAYLRKHYPGGMDIEKIAKRLGRDANAVYNKAKNSFIVRLDKGANQPNKIKWSDSDLKFIKKNFHRMTNVQLAKKLKKKLTKVRMMCASLGLKHMELEYWTPEQVEYLKANFRTTGDRDLARIFQERWPKKKIWSHNHIDKKRYYLGLLRTQEEQFLLRCGRYNPEDYEDFDGKKFPQGKKRMWVQNGKQYWLIKVGDGFVKLHRYNYEKHFGTIPKGKKVGFIDGNTLNPEPDNLILETQSEIAHRVTKKLHKEMSDSYVAGILARSGMEKIDRALKQQLMNRPSLLQTKRLSLQLNRKLKLQQQ